MSIHIMYIHNGITLFSAKSRLPGGVLSHSPECFRNRRHRQKKSAERQFLEAVARIELFLCLAPLVAKVDDDRD